LLSFITVSSSLEDSMNKMITRAAITTGAAVAALGLGVGSAMAATTVTVTGGGAYTASAASGVSLSAGVTMNCTSAGAAGTVTAGTYNLGDTAGTITSTTWNSCTALGFSSTVSQAGTWDITASAAPSGGVTPVLVKNVDATISIGGGICTVHVTGTAGGTFTNSTQVLAFNGTGNLVVTHSGLCPGVGSTGAFTGNYTVSAASPITIS